MKNLGSVLVLLAASASYVAAMPAGDMAARAAAYDDALEIYARGANGNAADAGVDVLDLAEDERTAAAAAADPATAATLPPPPPPPAGTGVAPPPPPPVDPEGKGKGKGKADLEAKGKGKADLEAKGKGKVNGAAGK